MSQSPIGNLGMAEWLVGAAQRNPEGILLVAAGCALMMRSTARGQQTQAGSQTAPESSRRGPSEAAREYMSDAGEKLAATASSVVSSAGDYADDARRTISETSGRMAQRTQSTLQETMTRVVQEQPLTFALLGLATGAAVAAVLPASEMEKEALGQAGEVLADSAEKAGQRLKDSASKAGERIKTVAEDSLKEVAKDVAGAFSDVQKSDSAQPLPMSSGAPQKAATSSFGAAQRPSPSERFASVVGDRPQRNSDASDQPLQNDASRPGRTVRSTGKRDS